MQETFKKIIEKLEEQIRIEENIAKKESDGHPITHQYAANCMKVIEKFVKQEAEKFGTDTNVGSNGWIPCSERLPEKNGYYYVNQIVKSISTGKKIAIEKAHVEFSEGKWRRAKHLEVIAWLDIEPYQPKGE